MDTVPGLRELQARKRELLLESDLNRQVLRVECGRIGFRLAQLRRGFGWSHHAWTWAAPVAGFLLARKFRPSAGGASKGSLFMGVLRSAWRMWENLRHRRSDPGPKS